MAKIFTLPYAQVGSILEYRYVISYEDKFVYSPRRYVQQSLYLRKAHYQFLPTEHRLNDEHGGSMDARVAYFPLLPNGAQVQYSQVGRKFSLDIANGPAVQDEE